MNTVPLQLTMKRTQEVHPRNGYVINALTARDEYTYNSQYCSLFFRPWTFLPGDVQVPRISLLGLCLDSLAALRMKTHTALPPPLRT